MKCPKCKTGEMRQMGFDSSNWSCELCGYREHRPRQRMQVPKYNSEMSKIQERMQASRQQVERGTRGMNRAVKQMEEINRQKNDGKKSGCGTILGILFVLWLLSKLLG